ncbi:hypothetical protein GH714_026118 [Hevea brasiliensis]|uniref:Auxin-responsive protein n=1 Tax=Hevea brasiliensis TaxID=3981 RepID=A0A6A6NJJ7_HEVBR|nr:hypothetical protein GH714_026118 [Hevea brasiliensis]
MAYEGDLNLKATELRLGLPGSDEPKKQASAPSIRSNKRASPEIAEESRTRSNSSASIAENGDRGIDEPPAKAQVVGWPPIRSYRKNCFQTKQNDAEGEGACEYSEREGYNGSTILLLMKTKKVTGCLLEMFHGKCLFVHARG